MNSEKPELILINSHLVSCFSMFRSPSRAKPIVYKILFLALLSALVYTVVNYDFSWLYFTEIRIRATGRKTSIDALSAEVWLLSPSLVQIKAKNLYIQKTKGWEAGDDVLYSYLNQPAELLIRGYLSKAENVEFLTHPWSGEALVQINGAQQQRLDLFRKNADKKVIVLGPYLANEKIACGITVFRFMALFIKSFLIAALILMVVPLIYNKLPALKLSSGTLSRRQVIYLILLSFSVLLLFCAAFYPGVMIVDSYSQYYEALRFYFYDWHPPAMAALWALTDKVIQGPGGMFLLHMGAAALSVFLLATAAALKSIKLYFAPIFLLFIPSISCFLFAVMKDVSFAVSLLFAFSLWYFWTTAGKLDNLKLFLIMVVVFYAFCIRHNSLPAILPLIVLFLSSTQNSRKKVVLFSLLLTPLFYLGNYFLTYSVLRANRVYISQTVMAHDLMGIYVTTSKNYFPENYLSKDKVDSLSSKFDYSGNLFTTQLISDSHAIADLKRQWIFAILEHPRTYLSNRWKLFGSFLFEIEWIVAPVSSRPFKELWNISSLTKETFLGKIHTGYVTWVHENLTFVFKAATYLFVSFLILVFSIRKKILPSVALSFSALLYIGHYFVVASIVNYRKIYWATFATFLSLIILWLELEGSAKEESGN